MSREIKFRAWDIKNKRFVNIVRLILDQFGALDYADVVFKGKIYKLYSSDIVLEQDTGIEDKNGKRIREGDIMRYDAIDYQILWSDYYASFETKRINSKFFNEGLTLHFLARVGRVIGNIHENPELLGSEE